MWKPLRAIGVAGVLAVVSVASLTARQQSSTRFTYLVVTPYQTQQPGRIQGNPVMNTRHAYRACVADASDWTCRQFEASADAPLHLDTALRQMLATLGSEGWDLVSAVDDTPDRDGGMTYVFKQPS